MTDSDPRGDAHAGIRDGLTLDEKKRIPMYREAQRILFDESIQVPICVVKKFQVVRRRVNNMYVAFSDFNTGIRYVYIK